MGKTKMQFPMLGAKHSVLKKKARQRRKVIAYFSMDEMPALERLMNQLQRDASSMLRWLVMEFESGRLVKAGEQNPQEKLDALRKTMMEFAERQAELEDEMRLMQGIIHPAKAGTAGQIRVTAPMTEISESGSALKQPGKQKR